MHRFLDVLERLVRPFPIDWVIPAAGFLGIGGVYLFYDGLVAQLVMPVLVGAILIVLSAFISIGQWKVSFGRAPRRQNPDGYCTNCGYDMRGGGDRCPECGRRYIADH